MKSKNLRVSYSPKMDAGYVPPLMVLFPNYVSPCESHKNTGEKFLSSWVLQKYALSWAPSQQYSHLPNPSSELDNFDIHFHFFDFFLNLKFWANLVLKLIVFQIKQNLPWVNLSHTDDYFNIYFLLFYAFKFFTNGTFLGQILSKSETFLKSKEILLSDMLPHVDAYFDICTPGSHCWRFRYLFLKLWIKI